jgi:hypothetical protein
MRVEQNRPVSRFRITVTVEGMLRRHFMWHEAFVIALFWLALQIPLGLLVAGFMRVGSADPTQIRPSMVKRPLIRQRKAARPELAPA